MHNIIIGQTNISDYIIEGTYEMDSTDIYESWKDANYVEHRIITTSKINGSFDVACCNKSGSIELSDFYNIFDDAATNGVITATVYVTNRGSVSAISAYYSLKNKEHTLLADGTFLDVITVELEEC